MSKKANTGLIIGAVAIALILLMNSGGLTKTGKKTTTANDVVRTFARTGLYTGESVVVTYTPIAADWSLDEILPTGWTVSGQTLYQQHLREYFSTTEAVPYTFIAPSTAGTSLFNTGQFQMGVSDIIWYTFPSQTITVTVCPGGTLTCDAKDNDCDHLTDEADEIASGPNCALTSGVCAGTKQPCSGIYQACIASTYGSNYEATTETKCDSLDNDCDGSTDESLAHTGALNTLQAGVCVNSKKSCTSGSWVNDYTGITGYVSSEDAKLTAGQCDGLDNDCDGIKDEPKKILANDATGAGDANCNNCIENTEFTTYKNLWKQTTKTSVQFTEVKNAWKTLEGC